MNNIEYLVIGKIRRPHGLKGAVLMEASTDFPERLRRGKTVYVGEQHEEMVINEVAFHAKLIGIFFEGINTSEQGQQLSNQLVYVRVDMLPDLPTGEYYHHQLVGLSVVDHQGKLLGQIEEILQTGANDVYLVRSTDGQEILLPAIEDVILEVSLEKKEMRVHPPEYF